MRRLVLAWSVFGVLAVIDVAALAVSRKGSAWHGLIDNGAVCAFIWSLFESFAGPRARDARQARDDRRAAAVAFDATEAQFAAERRGTRGGHRECA